jgi:antitoxin component of RelBE/YafQ-DinJ toxin-antitoxin module
VRQEHTWSMTELFRCRVDGELLADAKRVAEDIGTDCGVLVNIMFKQLVKRRTVPFPLMSDSAEDEILSPPGRRAAMLDEMYEGKPSAR